MRQFQFRWHQQVQYGIVENHACLSAVKRGPDLGKTSILRWILSWQSGKTGIIHHGFSRLWREHVLLSRTDSCGSHRPDKETVISPQFGSTVTELQWRDDQPERKVLGNTVIYCQDCMMTTFTAWSSELNGLFRGRSVDLLKMKSTSFTGNA